MNFSRYLVMLSSFRKKFVKVISGSDLLPVDTTVHVLLTLALNGAVIKCCRILLGCVTRTTIHKQMILTIVTSYLVPHTNMSNNCSIFRGCYLWNWDCGFRTIIILFGLSESTSELSRCRMKSDLQRPPPLDRDPLPWTETPSPGQRHPPLDRDPLLR